MRLIWLFLSAYSIQYFLARYVGLCLNYETFYIAPCDGLQGAVAQYAANKTRIMMCFNFIWALYTFLGKGSLLLESQTVLVPWRLFCL